MAGVLLTPRWLTQAEFSEFGDVIEIRPELKPIKINSGTTERYDSLAQIELSNINQKDDAVGVISIFKAQQRELPLTIDYMERHPLGSQAFLPFDSNPYFVLVAKGNSKPEIDSLKLFVAQGQGINYFSNTWHYPLLALHENACFWVVDRKGKGINCEEQLFLNDQTCSIPEDALEKLMNTQGKNL